ncbi:hypothetical protein EOI86_10850 [Hwanghaeella grinnelliae]|uniref:Uncharacterized protein n=1 Tax=Hwanghaeella grinnelliae TaxID=2500179 RepID=A0A437QMK8_9PROT|nr:hypothetical protein [Hwanghaeella grinnelliae]RVU35761.1 hypothetical protein EOI86_10850 [Hwanghaeella grinnelliae]
MALSLGGCSALMNKQIDDSLGDLGNTKITFQEALAYADTKKKELSERVDELEQFDFFTGTAMVVAGIAGLAFGLYDSHVDAIYGAGLVGGSAAAGRAFVPVSARKEAYLSGKAAITCAAVSFSVLEDSSAPAGVAPGAVVDDGTETLGKIAEDLKAYNVTVPNVSVMPAFGLNEFGASAGAGNQLYSKALSNVRDAEKDTLKSVNALSSQIEAAINTRATKLVSAVSVIIVAVNEQLSKARVDPSAAADALNQHMSGAFAEIRKTAEKVMEDAKDVVDETDAAEERAAIMTEILGGSSLQDGASDQLRSNLADIEKAVEDANQEAAKMQILAQKVLAKLGVAEECLSAIN